MRTVVLSRRELVALSEHNGFTPGGRRSGTSHVRYQGVVDGRRRFVDVDQTIDEYHPRSHGVLYYIVSSQLRFFGEDIGPAEAGWRRFYGGEPGQARRAQVPYRKWN